LDNVFFHCLFVAQTQPVVNAIALFLFFIFFLFFHFPAEICPRFYSVETSVTVWKTFTHRVEWFQFAFHHFLSKSDLR